MRLVPVLVVSVLVLSVVAGCTQPAPSPDPGNEDPAVAACPAREGSGFLAIAVQEGGLSPHPEVFTVEASGLATGIVLARGQPEDAPVGVPEGALHNVSEAEVMRVLDAADVPGEGSWNVSLAWQGTANETERGSLCGVLADPAPSLEGFYEDPECADGTTLTLSLWTPEGLIVSGAYCEGGRGTPFEEVRVAFGNATQTAREQSGAPS